MSLRLSSVAAAASVKEREHDDKKEAKGDKMNIEENNSKDNNADADDAAVASTPTVVADFGPVDVLLGSETTSLGDNVRYRQLVTKHARLYSVSMRIEQRTMALEISNSIHNEGGRFFEKAR
jgi:hypothetical protein